MLGYDHTVMLVVTELRQYVVPKRQVYYIVPARLIRCSQLRKIWHGSRRTAASGQRGVLIFAGGVLSISTPVVSRPLSEAFPVLRWWSLPIKTGRHITLGAVQSADTVLDALLS